MAQPILSVTKENTTQTKVQVNLLPCRIHHDGEVESIEAYWNPMEDNNQLKTAYVRGRKLHGTTIRLPQGYHGSVVEKGETKREIPRSDALDNDVDVEELAEAIEVAPLSSKASFTDFVIWGHESTAEAGADPYLRSIEEWVSFSEKLHAHPSVEDPST